MNHNTAATIKSVICCVFCICLLALQRSPKRNIFIRLDQHTITVFNDHRIKT